MSTEVAKAPITGDVDAVMNFWLAPELGGHTAYYPNTASYFRRKFDVQHQTIHDARGKEADFQLLKNGFQFEKHTSQEKTFEDWDAVTSTVYREVEELVAKVTGAPFTKILSHLTRRGTTAEDAKASIDASADDDTNFDKMTPALNAHIDFSRDGAAMVLKDNYPELYAEHGHKHWSIIGCWRPIKPVERDPMCFCDSETCPDENLKPVWAEPPPKGKGHYADLTQGPAIESYYIQYNPDHKYYWISEQTPEEVALFVLYDSKMEDGKTVRCPHSAFPLAGTEHLPVRESIEVRCLVFWD